jgi:predicted RNA-binding Zn ribbon-like protein
VQAESVRPTDHDGFVLVGGRPSLDLVATLGRRHAEPVERIPDPDTLARWFVEAGVAPAEPVVDESDLRRARALREAVHALVQSTIDRRAHDGAAIEQINRHAADPDLPTRLDRRAGGLVAVAVPGDARAALACVARDAVRLLGGPQARRIKECAHPDCSLVFLDETQSGRRRWCSMDRCGNLVKTAGYRARRAVPG